MCELAGDGERHHDHDAQERRETIVIVVVLCVVGFALLFFLRSGDEVLPPRRRSLGKGKNFYTFTWEFIRTQADGLELERISPIPECYLGRYLPNYVRHRYI